VPIFKFPPFSVFTEKKKVGFASEEPPKAAQPAQPAQPINLGVNFNRKRRGSVSAESLKPTDEDKSDRIVIPKTCVPTLLTPKLDVLFIFVLILFTETSNACASSLPSQTTFSSATSSLTSGRKLYVF